MTVKDKRALRATNEHLYVDTFGDEYEPGKATLWTPRAAARALMLPRSSPAGSTFPCNMPFRFVLAGLASHKSCSMVRGACL